MVINCKIYKNIYKYNFYNVVKNYTLKNFFKAYKIIYIYIL